MSKTVNEVANQLKLAKNKDAALIFRLGGKTYASAQIVEVVMDSKTGAVRFPELGENTNAVAVTLVDPNASATAKSAPESE